MYPADSGDVILESQKDLEDIKLREIQKHALIVNTSKGMEVSPEFYEKYHLTQGRYITNQDNREVQKVCVVRSEFAEENGLSIGDKLSLKMTDNANPKYYLSENAAWPDSQYVNEDFEIIGTYTSQNLEATNFLCDEIDVYKRQILKPALRALIALTVVFIYFQFCRYKNQLPADKLFPDFFQWGTTGRAE